MNKEWSITDDFYVSYLWDIIPLPIPNTRVLQAREEHKQIQKHLLAQRDLLKPKATESLQEALDNLKKEFKGRIICSQDATALKEARENLFKTANETLYLPDSAGRDLVETFLLVATLVLAFRTFFFQPFKNRSGFAGVNNNDAIVCVCLNSFTLDEETEVLEFNNFRANITLF